MKIHLRQIPPHGLHLEGEEGAEIVELRDDWQHARPVSPVRYVLDVGLSDGGLFATGTLAVDLQLECVACLEKFVYPLRVENFAFQTELTGSETVDLTPHIREDILLALPPYPHCDWNGEHACKGAARSPAETETPSESHTWDELDKLKLKSK